MANDERSLTFHISEDDMRIKGDTERVDDWLYVASGALKMYMQRSGHSVSEALELVKMTLLFSMEEKK